MAPTQFNPDAKRRRVDELASYFHGSISAVQDYTGRFEQLFQDYGLPILRYADESFERRPVSTVFTSIFLILSFGPVIAFVYVRFKWTPWPLVITLNAEVNSAFSCFSTVAFFVIGSTFATAASLTLVVASLVVLVSILVAAAFASAFLGTIVVSAFLLLRLAIMVRQDGPSAIVTWASDVVTGAIWAREPSPNSDPEPHNATNEPLTATKKEVSEPSGHGEEKPFPESDEKQKE